MQSALKHKLLVGGLAATAVLGVGAVASAASGVGPFDRGDDPTLDLASTGSDGTGGTAGTTPSGSEVESRQVADLPIGAVQTFVAGPAGTVTVARGEGVLSLAGTAPAPGFVIDEQEAVGGEVEVRFASGGLVVRFDAEIEDGVVRIRVRQEGAVGSAGKATSLTPGTVDDDDGDDRRGGDNSGPGHGDDDSDDSDNSGPGSGSGSGSSGHGGDDD